MASVLGLDTSASWCSVALVQGSTIVARRADVGNAHSSRLLPMVAAVLAEAATRLSACDAVAFGAGPGSFTGLRVACAAAQGLAFGASLPVVPIGTLDALAHSVLRDDEVDGELLVAQDARMGEVYWALFDGRSRTSRPVVGPALGKPESIAEVLDVHRRHRPVAVGVGNAWQAFGVAMDGLAAHVIVRAAADAVDIALLGTRELEAGRAVPAELALPLYVRDDVAQTTAQRASIAAARGAAGAASGGGAA